MLSLNAIYLLAAADHVCRRLRGGALTHEILAAVEEAGGPSWTNRGGRRSGGSVWSRLQTLHEGGYLTLAVEEGPGRGGQRSRWSITPQGRQAVREHCKLIEALVA